MCLFRRRTPLASEREGRSLVLILDRSRKSFHAADQSLLFRIKLVFTLQRKEHGIGDHFDDRGKNSMRCLGADPAFLCFQHFQKRFMPFRFPS